MSDKLRKRMMWSGFVVDNNDPLGVNRVRLSFDETIDGRNNKSILDSIPNVIDGKETKEGNDLKQEFKWSKIDYFCFLPLLPLFLKVTPKVGETVNIIWPNPNIKVNEQYYIQGPYSSSLTVFKENFESARMFATRDRIVTTRSIKDNGIFPSPEDVALIGRGTCDIIIKNNDVLLRAGKTTTNPDSPTRELAIKNTRSFIQLSDFQTRVENLGTKKYYRPRLDVQYLNHLIEWDIVNPENQYNNFILVINLYGLPGKINYTTKNFQIDTEVEPGDLTLISTMRYTSLSASTVSEYVNNFITQVNDGKINMPNYPKLDLSKRKIFPFYFRPSNNTLGWLKGLTNQTKAQFVNVTRIKDSIQFKEAKKGFGLVFDKNRTGQQGVIISELVKNIGYTLEPVTYNIQGADKLYLLSHESQIPGLQKIYLNEETIGGLTQDFMVDTVLPNTNSVVRGEELLKLLNLIVNFLVSHTHPFWLIPPDPQAGPVSVTQLLQSLSQAESNILNKNIRIN